MGKSVRAVLALAVVVGGMVAILAIGSMREDSATADEAAHIAAGLIKLREGRIDIYATQTPLIEAMIAAPLALAGYRVPEEWRQYGNRPWVAGHLLLYRGGYDPQRILRMARLPVIALLLALCFTVWGFVREVTGDEVAALVAFALTGFCPTLLAHGRLATVDMGLTLFMFLSTVLLLRYLRTPSRGLAIALGIAIACTLASKVSGALIVPFLAVIFLERRRPRRLMLAASSPPLSGPAARRRRISRRDAGVPVVALITFVAIYLIVARSLDLTLPFRAYLSEIGAVREFYLANPLPQFLLGELSQQGWPHYYLVAIAVKTPLPALALILLGIACARRFEAIVCFAFAALFLIVSAFSSLNLGIRHVLLIYPFLYAACAISVSRKPLAILTAAHVLTALIAYPSYLSYFNPLIGSHRNADRVLIDSNLDWGQDLRRLAHWTRENDIEHIRVHYFGAGSVEREFGSRAIRWAAPRPEPLPKGWFAVSRHYYRLKPGYEAYLRASGAKHVTTIGGSINVYRVD